MMIADVGNIGPDYLPGHAHADTLSFELSVGLQRVFVNSGISCYGTSKKRLKQRETSAHNTSSVDDANSSEVWSGFRVARRAYVCNVNIKETNDTIELVASHNGYRILKQAVIHKRSWYMKDHKLMITDIFTGKGEHDFKIFLHVHPGISNIRLEKNKVNFTLADDKKLTLTVSEGWNVVLENSMYHSEFGRSIPNKKIIISAITKVPAVSYLNISW